jgi:DNA-binding transcriptional MocR family regulator
VQGTSTREIVASVEAAAASGELAPGDRLPSVRSLAADLGVSPTTVASALADLRRRGVVVSRPRSGTEIARRAPVAPAVPPPVPDGVRDLATGNPDPALLPDVHRALRGLKGGPRLYGADAVDPGLRAVAAAALEGDGIDATDVCVVNGGLDGIERVLAAHLVPGDAVAVEDPGFPAVVDVVRALGLVPLGVSVEALDRLPDAARAVVVTPRGQNPTGAVMDARRLRRALRPGVLLVEDDHLGPAAGVAARTASTGHDRWAVIRSASKWLGPDLRLAVVAGDATTIRRVQGRQAVGPGWVSTLIQRTVAALWADPDAMARAEQAAAVYAGRRRALIAALAEHGIAATGDSGLNVWIPVDDEDNAVAGLLAAGWAVTAGARFRHASPPAIRVTVSTLRPEEAARLAADLAALLRPATRTRAA